MLKRRSLLEDGCVPSTSETFTRRMLEALALLASGVETSLPKLLLMIEILRYLHGSYGIFLISRIYIINRIKARSNASLVYFSSLHQVDNSQNGSSTQLACKP